MLKAYKKTAKANSRMNFLAGLLLSGLLIANSHAANFQLEKRQSISLEFKQFTHSSPSIDHNQDGSLIWQGNYRLSWQNDRGQLANELTIAPIIRYNSQDNERSKVDFKSLSWTQVKPNWELRAGIRTISWRTTEAVNLVDIINQADASANIDDEDKLGQAMVNWVWLNDYFSFELLALPFFRERIFPGDEARLRGSYTIDTDRPEYASNAENKRIDAAMRFVLLLDQWEIAVSHFSGTSREPILFVPDQQHTELRPYYPVIEQTGLQLEYAADNWLWKLEAISRNGFTLPTQFLLESQIAMPSRYSAATAGFELALPALFNPDYDYSLLAEYLWDERRDEALANDVFIGLRIGFNDLQSSELLLGSIMDLDRQELLTFIEHSYRNNNNGKIDLTVRLFDAPGDTSSRKQETDFFELHNDDYIALSYTQYF
ncbi:MAG: hypothetical protein CL691_06105 [Cellvibrionales bacterium]|nr:hypothetical protein [Cellvibrionales bacterium]|tara:strand:+ start:13154 stop:14446 length:1293 start_codon:yes stop_codon:yes gene_type:complete